MILDPHCHEFASACYDNPEQVADSFLDIVNASTLDWIDDPDALHRMCRLLTHLSTQPWTLLCTAVTSTDNVIALFRIMRFAEQHRVPIPTCEYITKTAQSIIPRALRIALPLQKTNGNYHVTIGLSVD